MSQTVLCGIDKFDRALCRFDVFAENGRASDDDADSRAFRHRACLLHRTLLGSTMSLQNLNVMCDLSMLRNNIGTRRQRLANKRIEMLDLTNVTIPPPAVWALDIFAPQVKSLDFMMSCDSARRVYEDRPLEERLPLIPDIRDLPVDVTSVVYPPSASIAVALTRYLA